MGIHLLSFTLCRDAWFMVASATALYTSAGWQQIHDVLTHWRCCTVRFEIYAVWIVAALTIQPIKKRNCCFPFIKDIKDAVQAVLASSLQTLAGSKLQQSETK